MKGYFDLICHDLPNADEVVIYPVCDTHVGAADHDAEQWDLFCRRVIAEPHSYVVLGGDLMNNNTRSSVGSPWDDTLRPREQKKRLVEQLKPLRDANKILCIVPGNHERRSLKDADDNPLYDVACKLDLEDVYREDGAFLKIGIGKRPVGSTERSVNVYALYVTHGAGGGIYTGATVNRNERFASYIDGIDAIIVGHTHKGAISRPSKIVVDTNRNIISMREVVVISATPWQAFGGYAAQKMLLPASPSKALRPQMLVLSGKRENRYAKVVW